MKEYLTNLWNKFKEKSVIFKTFMCFIVILYLGLVAICIIPVKTDSTVPGTISNVTRFISVGGDKNENKVGNIYTVSIYSQPKMSVLQYLFTKMDRNSEIYLGERIDYDIFTESEQHASDVGYKKQSIQDALIVAYTKAMKDNKEIIFDYSYKGEFLIHIPQNLFKTGAEDFKNSDIVTKFNGNNITSSDDYYNSLDTVFEKVMYEGKSIKSYKDENRFEIYDENDNKIEENLQLISKIYDFLKDDLATDKFTVIRTVEKGTNIRDEEIELTPHLKMLFYLYTRKIKKVTDEESKMYSIHQNRFSYFDIKYDKCNPKINIQKTQTVGPSGGLMQALAVYDAITKDDITKKHRVMGTGGINLDGIATTIGGEQQKVVTADLFSADIFFVPEENYASAKEMYDKKKLKFDLVSVNSLDDCINYLNSLEEKK